MGESALLETEDQAGLETDVSALEGGKVDVPLSMVKVLAAVVLPVTGSVPALVVAPEDVTVVGTVKVTVECVVIVVVRLVPVSEEHGTQALQDLRSVTVTVVVAQSAPQADTVTVLVRAVE